MKNSELNARAVAADARVDGSKIVRGVMLPDDWSRFSSAVARARSSNLHYCDDASITVFRMGAMLRGDAVPNLNG